MDQGIDQPLMGPTGGAVGNPFETLQSGLALNVYQAMEAILTSFDQCFQALEHTIVSSQSIQNAIQSGFANTNFHITAPAASATVPLAPPAPQLCLSAPCMTLQTFSGKPNENVQAWISLAEEALTVSQVPMDLWTYVVVQSLQDGAVTWYIAKKHENNDQTLQWDDMKQAMIIQWNNPARINELCMHLDTLPGKGSIAEYICQYQEIESQIPAKDMSSGDRIYKFITHLPSELYMTLIPWTEKENDITLFYSAARMWEGFHKILQKLATSRHWQGPCYVTVGTFT